MVSLINNKLKEMKFSIIVPIYNVETYLSECLESLINQTYSNIEVIAVNDGSTDSSPLILEKYAKTDSRIVVINQANKGLSEARNAGLSIATGNYVLFVDSDDYISTSLCQSAYQFIKVNGEIDLIQYVRKRFTLNYTCDDPIIIDVNRNVYEGKEWLEKSIIGGTFYGSSCNKIYKRSLIEKHNLRFYPNILYEDTMFVVQMSCFAKSVGLLPTEFYFYRFDRNGSIINTISERDKDILISVSKIEKFIELNFPLFLEKYFIKKMIYNWVNSAICYKHALHPFSKKSRSIIKDIINADIFNKYVKYIAYTNNISFKYKIPAWLSLNAFPLYLLLVNIYVRLRKQ